MNSLGIYVQVPFCQTKCTYCNFHTGVVSSARFAPYVQCVCEEMARHREFYAAAGVGLPAGIADAVVDTIYIGGGTDTSAGGCLPGGGDFACGGNCEY